MNIVKQIKETFAKFFNIIINLPDFLEGMKDEINRLTWPDWNSIVVGTVGVIAISLFTTVFVWISDFIISRILMMIIGG
ncbi:MAG: preprotein translocase subunit SecE [candidate division WOR-3 bacterium]